MRKQRIFIVDLSACFGCFGCVAACANANSTPTGMFWREVHKLPPFEGSSEMIWLSLACNHCALPPCVDACPSNALVKREEDGVVLHLEERCLGCRYCQMACPYDAIKWDESKGVVSKCHFCYERLENGQEPACVETCFAGALRQLEVEDPADLEKLAIEVPGFEHNPEIAPSVLFITKRSEGYREQAVQFPSTVPSLPVDG